MEEPDARVRSGDALRRLVAGRAAQLLVERSGSGVEVLKRLAEGHLVDDLRDAVRWARKSCEVVRMARGYPDDESAAEALLRATEAIRGKMDA